MGTTPVGCYLHGATQDGLFDLSGNVREWTLTRNAGYPYDPTANLEDVDATGVRITRGGSWAQNQGMVRCAFRPWNLPRNGDCTLGMRLARTLSL